MSSIDVLIEYLPFLIPLVLLQYGLAVYTIVHIIKHPRYKFGNTAMWIIVALLFGFLGPIAYFMFGRGEA